MAGETGFVVRPSPGGGRGVFAARDFGEGDVLFSDPVVEITTDDIDRLSLTPLGSYWWSWRGGGAVVFGLGSMMNHSHAPNVACRRDVPNRQMVFVADRPIARGEELTINYSTA